MDLGRAQVLGRPRAARSFDISRETRNSDFSFKNLYVESENIGKAYQLSKTHRKNQGEGSIKRDAKKRISKHAHFRSEDAHNSERPRTQRVPTGQS